MWYSTLGRGFPLSAWAPPCVLPPLGLPPLPLALPLPLLPPLLLPGPPPAAVGRGRAARGGASSGSSLLALAGVSAAAARGFLGDSFSSCS